MKDTQNPEKAPKATIEIGQLHGHQVDPDSVGEGNLEYLDSEQNDWDLGVPDEDYMQTVAETVFLLEQEGYQVETVFSVDDTYPQKSQLDFSPGEFQDVLDDGIINQYVKTMISNLEGAQSEVIDADYDVLDAVGPETYVWESELGTATLDEILQNDKIPEFEGGGKKGEPDASGILSHKENKKYIFEEGNSPDSPKIMDQTSPEEAYEQVKHQDFTCQLSHVGYAGETVGEFNNTEIPKGEIGISFTQNFLHHSNGGHGPSTSEKADQIMDILENHGTYSFENHWTFDAPYTTGKEVVEAVLEKDVAEVAQ